jgi:2-polyprenyl-6-hydroxyphenyl methylase/3-demethylubiquinone-9 3-methyltransferase
MANDLEIYERCGDEWWDESSSTFRSLRSVKKYHLELLRNRWGQDLSDWRVVDLGCGGGLLSIPLAERGADVVGVDRSRASLVAARREAVARGVSARFICADINAVGLADGEAHAVLLSDVLEHVDSPLCVIKEAARLLRAGGWLYVNTINRTWRARLLAVEIAERVGLIPAGTHDPAMFVRPEEVRAAGHAAGMRAVEVSGESVDPWPTLVNRSIHLRRTDSLAVGYNVFLQKAEA